jgi:hypothetical protein
MLSERLFEDILIKYPDLIEHGLKFIDRQINYFGKRIDILFEDRFKEKLIIELKKDNLDRNALSQVMEYEGYILSEKDPSARVMLIASRIPLNLKKAMDHHGIEYKEITNKQLMEFLEKKDQKLLSLIAEQQQDVTDKPSQKNNKLTMAGKLDEIIHKGGTWEELIAKAETESKKMHFRMKYSKGVLNAHIRYRTITQKNPNYLKDHMVTDKGIYPKNLIDDNFNYNLKHSRRSMIIDLLRQNMSDQEILEKIDKEFPPGTFSTSNKQSLVGTKRDLGL